MMERRNKDAAWLGEWYGAGELYVGRDYEPFRVLAGVRDDFPAPPISAKPPGMPKDASSAWRDDDARPIMEAISMIRGVASVQPHVVTADNALQRIVDQASTTTRMDSNEPVHGNFGLMMPDGTPVPEYLRKPGLTYW